jgi:hypothetical protein
MTKRSQRAPASRLPLALLAAGLLALVGQLVVAGEAERLPQLEDELAATLP